MLASIMHVVWGVLLLVVVLIYVSSMTRILSRKLRPEIRLYSIVLMSGINLGLANVLCQGVRYAS